MKYAQKLEGFEEGESRPWREVLGDVRPDQGLPSMILRGSRLKEELTQVQLAEKTGIPRRHLSEMENGKRSIGKETAKKLATALGCDYRLFL
ncbi:helix-turn-helix transcriptional regulator [Geomonas sp. Red32]|uniref:helix-turn-helix domain-containing protein n=1 Tax=Geomonas sp. Red32 TaxID=2912856 RepID=UPI00202CC57A|nr:helix-turn-helix transcriptional regulator [Geomonas sp. Red32]MCM0084104.1 helix-turn-helix transcriptional regulator [Geomonas sp. Red32]